MDLDKILKVCSDHNVKKIKLDNLEVEFGEPRQVAIPVFDSPLKEKIGGELKPTEDQLLYWSTGEPLVDVEAKPPEQ